MVARHKVQILRFVILGGVKNLIFLTIMIFFAVQLCLLFDFSKFNYIHVATFTLITYILHVLLK